MRRTAAIRRTSSIQSRLIHTLVGAGDIIRWIELEEVDRFQSHNKFLDRHNREVWNSVRIDVRSFKQSAYLQVELYA